MGKKIKEKQVKELNINALKAEADRLKKLLDEYNKKYQQDFFRDM